MGHQPVWRWATGHGPTGRHGGTLEARGVGVGHGVNDKDHVQAERQGRQRHPAAAGWQPISGLAVYGRRSPRALAVVVDGNDNVWISNFAMPNSPITQLCGVRTENCPAGFKTGDQISPPGGYVGGGLQMQVDVAVSPSGDVWVMNNWQDIDSCFGVPPEVLSTRCGGQGVVVFFGIAKPVRTPQIGPAQPL